VQGQADLLQVVGAFHAVGGFADLLHRRQQEPHQDADDADHDEQLDQREPDTAGGPHVYLASWEDPARPRGELLGGRNMNNRNNQ
jgi:hypothetical protein